VYFTQAASVEGTGRAMDGKVVVGNDSSFKQQQQQQANIRHIKSHY